MADPERVSSDDRDRGTITVWTIGMMLAVMFFGWLALSLWTAFAERRELASAADQAAQAGATALDVDVFRTTGVRQLDPGLAEQRAFETLAAQSLGPIAGYTIQATTQQVVVVVEVDVDLGLLSALDDEPLRVTVTAVGVARD
jgi:Flp pilus assembly protein TadG